MKRSEDNGAVSVTGPGTDRTGMAGLMVGLSYAQGRACHADRPGTWYVRDGDEVVFHVERHDDGLVLTRRRNGVMVDRPKGRVAERVEL